MLKQFTYAVSVLTAVASYAAPVKQPQFFEQGYPLDDQKYPAAYSAPARTDVRGGVDFFFQGSFIYYRPVQYGLELGALEQGTLPTRVTTTQMDYAFRPGFKVGVGVDLDMDNWVLDFEYTRLHTTNRATLTNPNPGDLNSNVISPWFTQFLSQETQKITAKWKCDIDFLDVNLGRPFYSGKNLTVHPTLGMRGGWINQRYKVSQFSINDPTITLNERQKSWLIGFRPGLGANWNIGPVFRFVQDIHAGLYYQRFRLSSKEQNIDDPTTIEILSKDRQDPLVLALESFTGVGFGGYFNRDRLHLDLLVGYHYEVMSNQNLMSLNGESLNIQGLDMTLRFDF